MTLTSNSTICQRLAALRTAMQQHHLHAYLVPSSDPHLSEYLPERCKAREWLSGFTGSVGTLIVTADKAGLWVDSRYWSQAEAELVGTGIDMMKITAGNSVQHIDWLVQNVAPAGTVGVDGTVLSLAAARQLQSALASRGVLLNPEIDLFAQIWLDRPTLPMQPIYQHLPPYATRSRAEKLTDLRTAMQAHGAQWHWISTLDDIAYLLNLRGADVSYNPIFVAHALVGLEQATLFIAEGKVPVDVQATLQSDGVHLAPYNDAAHALATLPDEATLLLDPKRVTFGMRNAIASTVSVNEAINPTTLVKSRKSAADAAHVRAVMEQDGAALCEFFAWLEAALADQKQVITELTIDQQIAAARARRAGFVSPSFGTIAGFNANGAMPHYRATAASHATIAGDGLLLIDSGGQYLGGTTDITRVVPIGQPSAAQKSDFTLVLKGMMALSATLYPRGTRAPMLDAIARAPIWAAGCDYGHGTGHGVGYFLNVHEGPQVIAAAAMPEPHTAMEEGMITSIEPGIYRPGKWGIRIENLVLNVIADTPAAATEFGEFLCFETLTLCPIDTRCIDLGMLRDDERAWLNDYHATVRDRLLPHVSGIAKQWLEQRTQVL